MNFLTDDILILTGLTPIDRNDPESESTAVEYSLPEGFTKKAKDCWAYLDDTAFLFEYKGRLVVTDESLYLTEHGDGTHDAPFGFPRWTVDSWEELEKAMEEAWDDLAENDML